MFIFSTLYYLKHPVLNEKRERETCEEIICPVYTGKNIS